MKPPRITPQSVWLYQAISPSHHKSAREIALRAGVSLTTSQRILPRFVSLGLAEVDQAFSDRRYKKSGHPPATPYCEAISRAAKLLRIPKHGVLTVDEVSRHLRVTNRHVLNLIEEKQIKAFNIGGSSRQFWRIPIANLHDFITSRMLR